MDKSPVFPLYRNQRLKVKYRYNETTRLYSDIMEIKEAINTALTVSCGRSCRHEGSQSICRKGRTARRRRLNSMASWIFCGTEPRKAVRWKEHIIPMWLLSLTGDLRKTVDGSAVRQISITAREWGRHSQPPALRHGGCGLNDEIIRAYEWLIDHCSSADVPFIFRFNRGAYICTSTLPITTLTSAGAIRSSMWNLSAACIRIAVDESL